MLVHFMRFAMGAVMICMKCLNIPVLAKRKCDCFRVDFTKSGVINGNFCHLPLTSEIRMNISHMNSYSYDVGNMRARRKGASELRQVYMRKRRADWNGHAEEVVKWSGQC